MSLYLTDRNTPVLGPLAKKVVAILGGYQPVVVEGIRSWHAAEEDEDEQYPNSHGDWMVKLFNKQMPDFNHELFEGYLELCDTIEDVLDFPECTNPVEIRPEPNQVVDLQSGPVVKSSPEPSYGCPSPTEYSPVYAAPVKKTRKRPAPTTFEEKEEATPAPVPYIKLVPKEPMRRNPPPPSVAPLTNVFHPKTSRRKEAAHLPTQAKTSKRPLG